MKKIFLILVIVLLFIIGTFIYQNNFYKIIPYYEQISKEHISLTSNQQPESQKSAHYVGSVSCQECHEDEHKEWSHSNHTKMIQNVKVNPNVVVADFLKLPSDADFKLNDVTYTIGSKFKQRFMIRKDVNGTEDYILGNKQWNTQTQKWQNFKPWGYWYNDAYPHDSQEFRTSNTCDGCHFVGYMSRKKRVEPAVGCESCHGPASNHVKNPKLPLYKASDVDSKRQNEVCMQCHMRNRDKRLEDANVKVSDLKLNAKDYPAGYEPGKSLTDYKMAAPFKMGTETKEFFANGAAKKNRSQGNEFIHSTMEHHGVTCINCHDQHKLTNTAEDNQGNELCMTCHSFGSSVGPHQNSLSEHTKHKANSKGSLCVECHMPKTAKHTKKSPLSVRSHLFGFTSPKMTKEYGMPKETNACYACHSDKTLDSLQKNLLDWGNISWKNR